MGKRLNNESFIEKSIDIHGNRYDYSMVCYKNNKTKIKIICQKHGVFEQMPINHINGKSGCPKCYGNVKLTNEIFIERSQLIHNQKYDYSLVNYVDSKEKVKIICKQHGEFEQTPNVHLDGHGCFKCGNKNDLETFIIKANEIYGNLFNYDKVEYININTPINIVCKVHGDFITTPNHFLYKKSGCIYCNGRYKNMYFFLQDAEKIHGNKYKYEIIDNLNKNSYIKIICQVHGEFIQRISSHIGGCGCNKCKNDILWKKFIDFLLKKLM